MPLVRYLTATYIPVSIKILLIFLVAFYHSALGAENFVDTIKKVKPSIVGIGINSPLSSPPNRLVGTGFIIAGGKYVVTNHHVVSEPLEADGSQKRVIFIGSGERPTMIESTVIASDTLHDIAILSFNNPPPRPLLSMTLANENWVDDGTEVGFTGFPIGAVLGLYPVTHKGMISSRSPVAIAASNSRQLSVELIKRLREPFFTYQLDATAYPGNSGSPVYLRETGEVIAVINKVFVKTTKEAVLSQPSGITYAIPVKYIHQLLARSNIEL